MGATGVILAAGLMGLAGMPHCAAMCAAPCAAATRACGSSAAVHPAFHLGRLAGYAAAGAMAASSLALLQQWLAAVPALRPLWTLLHLAALALGLWLLLRGRMPGLQFRVPTVASNGWQRIHGPTRGAVIGSAWIAWPCALSQSALLVSALAGTAWQGGLAMAAFALASSPALMVGPWVLARIAGTRQGQAVAQATWGIRAAGLTLVAASGWALGHGLWERVAAWCAT